MSIVIGVLLSGCVIWFYPNSRRAQLADPFATFVFAGIVCYSSFTVASKCIRVLMEGRLRKLDAGC